MKRITRNMLVIVLALSGCSNDNKFRSINESFTLKLSPAQDQEIVLASVEASVDFKEEKISAYAKYSSYKLFSVSLPIDGFLKDTYKSKGDFVQKGDLLMVVEHPEYLNLKRDYLKAKNEFNYQQKNYLRQGELAIERATSLRNVELSERNYNNAEIELNALASTIKLLGIEPKSLNIKNINPLAYVYSPVSARILEVNSISGKLYATSEEIFRMTTDMNLLVEFECSLKDSVDILPENKVEVLNRKNNNTYAAEILSNTQVISTGKRLLGLALSSPEFQVGQEIVLKTYRRDTIYKIPERSLIDDNWIIIRSEKNTYQSAKIEVIEHLNDVYIIRSKATLENVSLVREGHTYLLQELRQNSINAQD